MPSISRLSTWRVAAVAAVVAIFMAGCGSTGGPVSVHGGTVTFAEQPLGAPNYIFPLMPGSYANSANISDFQFLMFRPLYWFGYQGQPHYNPTVSLANRPVFSNGGTAVTVTLKPYRWSNGTAVTSSDVALWVNMVKAERPNWFAYVPGAFPDNIVSMTLHGTNTISFQLTRAFSQRWFLHNELSQITPLPAAWDETAPGVPSHCATTIADCAAVYNFLAGQSKSLATYAKNPLWQIVDGPFKLSQFTSGGFVKMVPNKGYSGSPKPTISAFEELPFSSDTAEYTALRGGGVTYGYVPPADVGQTVPGYTVQPWYGWATAFMFLNYHNPTAGPMFAQLYVRQAMQHLIDQPALVKAAYRGAAAVDYGPVPMTPSTSLVSSYVKSDPYSFSVATATALLRSHGWKVVPDGTDTCVSPGTGSGHCGAGIAAGTPLAVNYLYQNGSLAQTLVAQFLTTDFAKAGIKLTVAASANILGATGPCTAGQPSCSWQIANFGSPGWFYGNDNYPTGGEMFQTGAGFNFGSYSNSALDALILKTHTVSSVSALYAYENFMGSQLPVLWEPVAAQQVSAVKDTLAGAYPQDPVLNLYPENWHFTK
ncbi:MAG: ABC transporter substrate-binding protein [Candidatus Dormibacteria bacterium]